MKQVTRNIFFTYLEQYPRQLERNDCEVTDMITYNDFSLGGYPDCIVAKYVDKKNKSQIQYFINENI